MAYVTAASMIHINHMLDPRTRNPAVGAVLRSIQTPSRGAAS